MESQTNNPSTAYRALSWDDYHHLVKKVYDYIKVKYNDAVLFPIPRGGVIPAVMLSHLSDNSYKIEYQLDKLKDCENPLLIEDILDTGKTVARLYDEQKREYPVVSLFYKETSIIKPDYYSEITEDWIIFPYEKADTVGQYNGTV